MANFHDFTLTTIDGEEQSLSTYAGKAVLVVNVASKCGLTPQYEGLEALYRSHAERGLTVLGFPCNQFMEQEPGTEAEIKTFCSTKYDVTFPLFGKLDVKGDDQAPLYAYLTSEATAPDGPGEVLWNFAKFVIDPKGEVVARFGPKVEPGDEALVAAVEAALP